MTPIIAAFPKALFPFLVILPGMIGIALMPNLKDHYDDALPRMLQQFYPSGLLGLGITALLASFMSGMAGNVTAFNTVFTYDIYQAHIRKGAPDAHYLSVGRWITVVGIAISIGTAYIVLQFNNLMDYMQLLFSFFNAPLFATFLLGMFWKRATSPGAFWGLLGGIGTSMLHYLAVRGGVLNYPSDMATNFYGATYAFTACLLLTLAISFTAPPMPEGDLKGLVYALSPVPPSAALPWFKRPLTWGIVVLIFVAALNLWFW
jgi:SSS family solute:Na+ symporter